jgi:hypothetical protein
LFYLIISALALKSYGGMKVFVKSIRWMPRHGRPMKDAVGVRYASGRSQTSFDPEISEWGNPPVEETGFPSSFPLHNMHPLIHLKYRDQDKGYTSHVVFGDWCGEGNSVN